MLIYLGKFENTSGEFMVSDPVYERGTWCQKELKNVAKGKWAAYVDRKDIDGWGKRNVNLFVLHEDFVNDNAPDGNGVDISTPTKIPWKEEENTSIGVDSGCAGIFNNEEYQGSEGFHDACCSLARRTVAAGIFRNGVVSSSGIGDGVYLLYTHRNKDGMVDAVNIAFADESEYKEDDDDDENNSKSNINIDTVGMVSIELIAKVCHEVNKTYCEEVLGDFSQKPWEDADEWQRVSAINGVKAHIENNMGPEDSHEIWMKEKLDTGWKYGPVKDAQKKEHPCLVAYDELPKEQQTKDKLFKAICDSFKGSLILQNREERDDI